MATVEETLAAFPEYTETETPIFSKKSQSSFGQMGGTRPSPSPEESDSCLVAVKAAMDVIDESCVAAHAFTINIAGINIRVLPSVMMISQIKLGISREDHENAIRESAWCKTLVQRLCEEIRGFTAGTPEYDECTAKVEEKVIDQLVK